MKYSVEMYSPGLHPIFVHAELATIQAGAELMIASKEDSIYSVSHTF
jgi:hypothetical protein